MSEKNELTGKTLHWLSDNGDISNTLIIVEEKLGEEMDIVFTVKDAVEAYAEKHGFTAIYDKERQTITTPSDNTRKPTLEEIVKYAQTDIKREAH